MNNLILGGNGLIGQALMRALPAAGVNMSFDLDNGPEYDLRTPNELLAKRVEEADFVYFLAFDVGGSSYLASHQYSYEFLENNAQIMSNTFRTLKEASTPFLFASSQMSNMTTSPYGVLKNVGEHYTRSLGGINVRLWNVYGRETDPDKFHVITDFINKARTGHIQIVTDGQEVRQFLHADDCARALIKLAAHHDELDLNEFYDVTSFNWVSILDLAHRVARAVGSEVTVAAGQEPDTLQTKRNEPTTAIMPYWYPKIHLDEGIKILIEESNESLYCNS